VAAISAATSDRQVVAELLVERVLLDMEVDAAAGQ
jgi:hypothetical protein